MANRVILAGGSGYIGHHLASKLAQKGYEVVILTRHPHRYSRTDTPQMPWDGRTAGAWQQELEGSTAVVNLSGESVAKHWDEANKLAILESRVYSTRAIGEAIDKCSNPPKVWVNASAVGYYGDRGEEVLTEDSGPGEKGRFLVDVCVAWEDEQVRVPLEKTRKVRLRTGVVLGKGSSPFEPLRKLTTFFLGGQVGNGQQEFSWVHIEDLAQLYVWAIENDVSGALNATSPEPVTNENLMFMMRSIMKRPWALPVPAFLLKLVSALGGPEASLLLDSEKAVPKKALEAGFQFRFPRLREALTDLLVEKGASK